MSYARAKVTMSAPKPSISRRACFPEPSWDCLIVTWSPVLACQYFEKEAFSSAYNSLVGSYGAFRSVSSLAQTGFGANENPSMQKKPTRIGGPNRDPKEIFMIACRF